MHFKQTEHWTIVAELSDDGYCMDFRVYEGGFSEGLMSHHLWDTEGEQKLLSELDRRNVYLHGNLNKTDEMNLYFDAQDTVMLYFPNMEEAQSLGILMRELYVLAHVVMGNEVEFGV